MIECKYMENFNPINKAKELAQKIAEENNKNKIIQEEKDLEDLKNLDDKTKSEDENYYSTKKDKIEKRDELKKEYGQVDSKLDSVRKMRQEALKEIQSVEGGWEAIRRDYDTFKEIFGDSSEEVKNLKIEKRENPKEIDSIHFELVNFTAENLELSKKMLEEIKNKYGNNQILSALDKKDIFDHNKEVFQKEYLPNLDKFLEQYAEYLNDEVSWVEGTNKYPGYSGLVDKNIIERLKVLDAEIQKAQNSYEEADKVLREYKDKGKSFWQSASSYQKGLEENKTKSTETHKLYDDLWAEKRKIDNIDYELVNQNTLNRSLQGSGLNMRINDLTTKELIKENPKITIKELADKCKDLLENVVLRDLKPTEKEELIASIYKRLETRIRVLENNPYY
jgi:hypothetical protein